MIAVWVLMIGQFEYHYANMLINISLLQLRYYYRGNDHPFTLNEIKDYYFKLRENYLIQE